MRYNKEKLGAMSMKKFALEVVQATALISMHRAPQLLT